MRLPFFSSFTTTTAATTKKGGGAGGSSSSTSAHRTKKKKQQQQQQGALSSHSGHASFSSSSSDPEAPTTPTTVIRPFLGRHASCLDPEYCPPASLPALASDGTIATHDLQNALARLGSHHGGVADLLAEADPWGSGRVALHDLFARGQEDEEEQLRVAFGVYDVNGDGKISPEELFEVLRTLGDASCTLADCRRMIVGVDSDGDGLVCFADFSRMMSLRSSGASN